jgi:hypothetical protein
VGCGNSLLGRDLARAGYPAVTCIDVAPSAVEAMRVNSGPGATSGVVDCIEYAGGLAKDLAVTCIDVAPSAVEAMRVGRARGHFRCSRMSDTTRVSGHFWCSRMSDTTRVLVTFGVLMSRPGG